MKGDFSRDTFSFRRHYNAVLMQQGRVQVDADWNEQRAIDRHRTETETRDLIGSGGGQVNDAGFGIRVHDQTNLSIGPGNLYVDGILCQNEESEKGEPLLFDAQADLQGIRVLDVLPGDPEVGLVYLDVWEQHVTTLDDDHIREVALGGPDTATRSRTVWQAKVLRVQADTSKIAALQPLLEKHVETVTKLEDSPTDELRFALAQTDNRILELLGVDCESTFEDETKEENPPSTGLLAAQAVPPASTESKCAVPPSAGYERLENQLYRVEIHEEGDRDAATFKWSRENGSVETAVLSITPRATATEIVVQDLGRDEPLGFAQGQYVELIDDSREQAGQAGPLMQIASDINPTTRTIIVDEVLTAVGKEDARKFHYKLRRWDSTGALEIPSDDEEFVPLEGGIKVRFAGDRFNTGDYWLIPARTATGEIEWPYDENVNENGHTTKQPLLQPPAGIEHHYAPLALVMAATVNDVEQLLVLSDCRRLFPPLTGLRGLFYLGGDGQEAGSGQPLPKPLVVGVANGDRPVLGARVRFEVQAEDLGRYDGKLEAEGNSGKSVTVTTNARGEAQCSWTLATDLPSQQVRTTLLDGTHLPIYFNANLSAAGEAVAKSIQITELLLANGQELRVDGNVPVDALAEGIQVVCDDDSVIDERTVAERPNCFVTLEMPFPQSEDDFDLWGEAIIGFRPLILAADLNVEDNLIRWEPAQTTGSWLRDMLFQRFRGTERVLARLTLKGNFIWDEKRPDAYLDGEVFGVRRRGADFIELRFPSGDGRRGGDFEMWFWLVSQTLILDSLTLDRDRITGGTQTMRGTVRILGTAPTNGALVKLTSSSPGVVTVPGSVRIEAGGSSASFEVRTAAVAADTPVTITAILETQQGSMQKSADLMVQPPALSAVSVDPSTVTGKTAPVQGTVTLTGPAPTGNINVALSSADPNVVKIQPGVTVPAGSNTAGFSVTTEPVSSPTPVTITASAQNVQRATTLTVQPPLPTQLTLNPTSVLGGRTSQGTVQIGGPAPGGFTVELRSANPALATVQSSVTVPEGSSSATFTVNARPVASGSLVNIVASRSGVERTATLSVQSPVPTGFAFSPQRIAGNQASTGTITLSGPAPGGTSIALSASNSTTANIPLSAAVQPDATQVGFTATGKAFTGADRSVTVTASYLGGSRSADLTVAGGKSKEKDTKEKDEVDFASFEMLTAEGPRSTAGTAATDEEGMIDDTEEAPAAGRPFIRGEELPRLSEPGAKPINEQPK